MGFPLPPRFLLLFIPFFLALSACASLEPVRHLSSDICLITPNLTQKEVLASLGQPDQKQKGDQGEIWIYFETKKDLFRKAPLIGEKIGTENYEVATIHFVGDLVSACFYRAYDKEELKKSGIKINGPRPD